MSSVPSTFPPSPEKPVFSNLLFIHSLRSFPGKLNPRSTYIHTVTATTPTRLYLLGIIIVLLGTACCCYDNCELWQEPKHCKRCTHSMEISHPPAIIIINSSTPAIEGGRTRLPSTRIDSLVYPCVDGARYADGK